MSISIGVCLVGVVLNFVIMLFVIVVINSITNALDRTNDILHMLHGRLADVERDLYSIDESMIDIRGEMMKVGDSIPDGSEK